MCRLAGPATVAVAVAVGVHADNFGVYGVTKMRAELNRLATGCRGARCIG